MSEALCIVAVGAHAADMEFTAGATLLKHVRAGWTGQIINLTLGEKGSGTLSTDDYGAQKKREAEACAAILGVTQHFLPYRDGELVDDVATARALAVELRRLRPEVVITHWKQSMHLDHEATYRLCRQAIFMAANRHFELDGLPPKYARCYLADNWEDDEGFRPYLYVDVSEVWDEFERAFKQFAIGRGEGGYPYWDWYQARCRIHGIKLGVRYAQAFAVEERQMLQRRDLL